MEQRLLGITAMPIDEREKVHTISKSDKRNVLASLSLAFVADPGVRWFFPSPPSYQEYFPKFVLAYGGKSFEHGTAHSIGNWAGAALWVPPEVQPDDDAIDEVFMDAMPDAKLATMVEFEQRLERYYPEEPFWELAVLGVEPTQQGKGYGTRLMEAVLTECDRTGSPAFLISSNVRNLSFYLRHGFEILDTIQLGSMPPFFPMRRDPQA